MSVDSAEEDEEQRMEVLQPNFNAAVETGRPAAKASHPATDAAAAAMAGDDHFHPPTRTLSRSRCSQERGDVDGMSGVDAEGGANVDMPAVDTDPLQLHSSQPQTMV